MNSKNFEFERFDMKNNATRFVTLLGLTFFAAATLAPSQRAVSQVKILPEWSTTDPRLAALRARFQAGGRATRKLDTYVDVKVPGKQKEMETIERIVQGYLIEVGAEPVDRRDARNATFRLEISSIQKNVGDNVSQSVFFVLYDGSLPQGERAIMRSRTDLQCTLIYRKDYHTFVPPDATCIRDEKHLREGFLRIR